jgi:hypothetical protein
MKGKTKPVKSFALITFEKANQCRSLKDMNELPTCMKFESRMTFEIIKHWLHKYSIDFVMK